MKRFLCVVLSVALTLVLGVGILCFLSLPSYDGRVQVEGIRAPVHVTFDSSKIPTIDASCRADAAFALGYLHGKERFFQMDMMRRAASGELSELFGPATKQVDCQRRWHRFRKQAHDCVATLPQEQQEILSSYSQGVNTALRTSPIRPWEYLLLLTCPKDWSPEDSLLVIYNLYFELQESEGELSHTVHSLQQVLTAQQQHDWITPSSVWTTFVSKIPKNPNTHPPSSPPSDTIDLSSEKTSEEIDCSSHRMRGSNGFAIDGAHSASHKAIVAGELHLPMTMPSLWYRASLIYTDGKTQRHVHGFTLPGLPLTIVGSNEHCAWTVTNGQCNGCDIVYGRKEEPLSVVSTSIERIVIRGDTDLTFSVEETPWGPIRPAPFGDQQGIVHWIAHEPSSANLNWLLLERASSVDEAIQSARSFRLPVMNLILGDNQGNIGWCLCGALPSRSQPQKRGYIFPVHEKLVTIADPDAMPFLINPESGYLCSANQQPVPDANIGWGGEAFLNPIRAYEISSWLRHQNRCTVHEALTGLLIDRASFFDRWKALMLLLLDEKKPDHMKLKEALLCWDGHCTPSSCGYVFLRQFREIVVESVSRQQLLVDQGLPHLDLSFLDLEEPVWNSLVASSNPLQLHHEKLPLLHTAIEKLVRMIAHRWPDREWSSIPWAEINTCQSIHPLAQAFPFLGFILNGPVYTVGGDFYVPRVAWKESGATLRTVLSPGKESCSIAQLPGGQSGHPLSSHYKDGFADWMAAAPAPLLPGPLHTELVLTNEP